MNDYIKGAIAILSAVALPYLAGCSRGNTPIDHWIFIGNKNYQCRPDGDGKTKKRVHDIDTREEREYIDGDQDGRVEHVTVRNLDSGEVVDRAYLLDLTPETQRMSSEERVVLRSDPYAKQADAEMQEARKVCGE